MTPLIIDSLSEAIVAIDFDGTVIYWNPAAERAYGWSAEEILGQSIFEMMAHLPAIERTRAAVEEMRTRESWTREVSVERRDGTAFTGEITMSQLRDVDGSAIGIVVMTSDISDRRHAEKRLSLLFNVSRLLADAEDISSVGTRILKAICDEIHWEWGALWVVDRGLETLRCVATYDGADGKYESFSASATSVEFPKGRGLLGSIWERGEPEWIPDFGRDPRAVRRNEAAEAGLKSAIVVPIQLGVRDVHGVIEHMTSAHVEPNHQVLEMIAAAARQLGLFIERHQAYESVADNEFRLRRLEESDLIGIIRTTLDGRIIGANDAFLHMTGYSADDLDAGLSWSEITPPEWSHVDPQITHDVITHGRSGQREKEIVRKDGSRLAILLGATRIDPAEDEMIAFVVDITARKDAELAASEARLRAEGLLDVTAGYSRAQTVEDIAQVTITEGLAALQASGCSFTLLNEEHDGLRFVASVGYGPGMLDRWKETPLSLAAGLPVTECVVRGEPLWVQSHKELFDNFPLTRSIPFPYSASIAAVPLRAYGGVVGAINIGFSYEREFSASDRVFIETLVQFCGQALERAWLYEREQDARKAADFVQKRAEQLLDITAALSRALTPVEVAHVIVNEGFTALGVRGGAIALLDEENAELNVVHVLGYPILSVSSWEHEPIPLRRHVPMTEAIKTGEPIWVFSRQELSNRFPYLAGRDDITTEALVAIPLSVGDQVFGVLGLLYDTAEQLDAAEQVYVRTLGRLSSQAMQRAFLFEREHTARVSSEQAQQRLEIQARAGGLLTSSLDTNETLGLIARLLVPDMADWCAIDVLGQDGLPSRVSVVHVDPDKVRWAEDLQRTYPFEPDRSSGLADALRTGKPVMHPYVTEEMMAAAASDDAQLAILREIGFQSVMIVPMIARGRTLGAMTLVHAESGRHFDDDDLSLIEDLAYRAALAVDNARLFEESQVHARRMNAIAEASRLFAESGHDIQAIVDNLARHITRHIGDWSVVRLISDDGVWLNPVAIQHADADARAALNEMFLQDPLRVSEGLTGSVAATGEAVMLSSIAPDAIRQRLKPSYRTWMDRYPMHAVLIVPIRRRNQVLGTIAMFRARPDAPYTEDDRRFAQNLADRAALSLENAQLFHQAQDAVRLREEFLSIASHEMRTPLTTITGFAHLLNRQFARGTLDESRIETILSGLLSEATRLDQLVSDLLDVSRIQQGRLDIRPEPGDLSFIVRDVVDRLRTGYEGTQGRNIVVESSGSIEGIWDTSRIDQVVTNLITNALKYSEDGDVTVRVWEEHQDAACLSVQDRGYGIHPDHVQTVFQPFSRGPDAHHRASGTGLGLYITRQIVEHHGGSIELESTIGEGTTVTVRLPMESVVDPDTP